MKEISTTNGKPSILVPLSFVLIVTGIKDFFEDYVSSFLTSLSGCSHCRPSGSSL
jgi:hypothetical protein